MFFFFRNNKQHQKPWMINAFDVKWSLIFHEKPTTHRAHKELCYTQNKVKAKLPITNVYLLKYAFVNVCKKKQLASQAYIRIPVHAIESCHVVKPYVSISNFDVLIHSHLSFTICNFIFRRFDVRLCASFLKSMFYFDFRIYLYIQTNFILYIRFHACLHILFDKCKHF